MIQADAEKAEVGKWKRQRVLLKRRRGSRVREVEEAEDAVRS